MVHGVADSQTRLKQLSTHALFTLLGSGTACIRSRGYGDGWEQEFGYVQFKQITWGLGGSKVHWWLIITLSSIAVVAVQSLSRVWVFATPWTTAHQASLSLTISRSSPTFMSIESVTYCWRDSQYCDITKINWDSLLLKIGGKIFFFLWRRRQKSKEKRFASTH